MDVARWFLQKKKKKFNTAFNHASTHNTASVGLLTSMNETRINTRSSLVFHRFFKHAELFWSRKNSKYYFYMHACVYTRIMFLYRDIGQTTPCRTLGIKIIITLEIGHGGGTLVIFGGHMPAGTKPGERERRRKKEKKKKRKKKETIAYLIWHYGTGLGRRLTLFNRDCSSLWSRILKKDEWEGCSNGVYSWRTCREIRLLLDKMAVIKAVEWVQHNTRCV